MSWWRSRGFVAALVSVVLAAGAVTAWAIWSAAASATSHGAASGATVNQGATPTATGAPGHTITVSWAATTLSGGHAVDGYVIRRYISGGAVQSTLASCSGTIAGTSCSESAVPDGSWRYTVTPVIATNWQGVESVQSTAILVDTTAPTGSAQLTPAANGAGWNNSSPVAVALTATDGAGSGVNQIKYTTDGTDPTTSGTATVYSAAFSISANTTVKYYATDNAGNASSVQTQLVKIDTAAPANAISLSSVSGGALLGGTTVYYRGAAAGSLSLTNTLTDTGGSGVASSGTSALGGTSTGLSHTSSVVSTPTGGPYVSNPFSWTAGASSSPTETVTGTDTAGNTATTVLLFANDSVPASGGSVDATGLVGGGTRYTQSLTLHVAFAKGSDGGSGLAASGSQLLRASATLTSGGTADGVCGAYGSYTQVGSNDPASPVTDIVPGDNACYSYEYTVPDKIGNVATYTSGDVKVETTTPGSLTPGTGTIAAVTGAAAQFVSGSSVFYNPASAGSFTVDSTAGDTRSGVAQVAFPAIGGFSGGGNVTTPNSGTAFRTTYSWSANGASASPGAQSVTATNNATAAATNASTFSVVKDATAPAGGSVDASGLVGTGSRYSTSTTLSVAFTKGTDGGSGLASSGAQLLRATGTLSSGGTADGACTSYGSYAQVGSNDPASPVSDTVPADNACYRYEYTVADKVGNVATYTSGDVKVESTAPGSLTPSSGVLAAVTGTTAQSVSGSSVFYNPASSGSFTVDSSASDTRSGVAQVAFPAIGGFSGGGNVTTPNSGTTFRTTYSWSANGASASPGAQSVSATNNATATATNASTFSVIKDATAPSGGSVDATGLVGTGSRYSTSTTLSVALAKGTDGGSGLAASGAQLLRATATLTSGGTGNGACGAYGSYTQIGSNDPASPVTDIVPGDNACYSYEYTVPDKVGNVVTYTSSDIKVETTAPGSLTPGTGTIAAVTGAAAQFVSGSSVFYNPASAGSFTVDSTAGDTRSGVAQVAFPASGGFSGGGNVTTPNSGTTFRTTYSWSANGASASPGAQSVTATNNATATATNASTFSVIKDATAPAGGSIDASGLVGTGSRYSTSTTLSVAFTKGTDGGSGLASSGAQLLRATGTLSSGGTADGACTSYGSYAQVGSNDPASPVSDTVPADNACYRYEYTVADKVGNVATYTSGDIKVETTTPGSLTPTTGVLAAVTGTASQVVSGSSVFYNPASSGSFTVDSQSSDVRSGVAQVAFPAIGGFSGGGNVTTPNSGTTFRTTYSWSANGASASPGAQSVSATNNASSTATNASTFSVIKDATGPSGGSVDATGLVGTGSRYSTSTTLSVSFGKGTDGGSGLAASGAQLLRASATLSSTGTVDGTCGSYSTYAQVGANDPATPKSDTVADHACYRYEYVVADNVGNSTTYTSGDIKVDTTAPAAPTVSFSAFTNASATGTVVYYQPGASSGGFTVTGTASDFFSGIGSFAFPSLGSGWTGTPGALGVEAYSYSAPNPTAPSGGKTATATNNASVTSAASTAFTVVPDSTAPTGGTVSYTTGYYTTASVSVTFTPGTDGGSGVNASSGILQRASTGLSSGACGTTYSSFATIVSNPTSPYVDTGGTTGNCYEYRYLISDAVGNQSAPYTSANVVKLDTQAPSQAFTLTSPVNASLTGTTLYYNGGLPGSFKFVDTLTDTVSGVASATFPSIATTGWTHLTETQSGVGPFTSTSFSWTATPSTPSAYSVSATDVAGNTAGVGITFTSDTTPPTGGTISYTTAIYNALSVGITTTSATDGGSGIANAVVKRDVAPLATTPSETCGTYTGTFSIVTLVGGNDTSVTSGHCYKYEYVVTDNVGNVGTFTSASVATVDTSGPQVTAMVSQNAAGGAASGKLVATEKLILTFNQSLATASVPTSISAGASENRAGTLLGILSPPTVTITIPGIAQGTVDTGSTNYFSNTCVLLCNAESAAFTASVALVNAGTATTVTVTLLTVTPGSGSTLGASSGQITFPPASSITDGGGNGASGTFPTASNFKLF